MGWRRIRRTNTTDASFPSRLIQEGEPSGIGDSAAQATASAVIDLAQKSAVVQNGAVLMFYGAGSNNNTFSARIIGWRWMIEGGDRTTAVWVPTVLAELACTLSSTPIGIAGRILANTDLFADTVSITGTTANAGVSIDVVSPANDTPAHVTIDLVGWQKAEITFQTGSSATNANGLIALL